MPGSFTRLAGYDNSCPPSRDSIAKNTHELCGSATSHVTLHFINRIQRLYLYISVSQRQSKAHTPLLIAFNEQGQTCPCIQSLNNPIVRLSGYYERHPLFAPSGIPCSRGFLIHFQVCPIAGRLLSISVL